VKDGLLLHGVFEMATQLHSIFPTPVFTTNFKPSDELLHTLKSQKFRVQEKGVGTLYGEVSENVKILRLFECSELKDVITYHANILAKEILGYQIKTMVDVLSWISIKRPRQQHTLHTHPNSVISGVYYFDNNIDNMPIIFGKPKMEGHNVIRVKIDEDANESTFCKTHYKYQPSVGDIVLFPSHLHHVVDVNSTNRDRFSLAFNMMPKSGIGEALELTEFFYSDAI
jgi:uncharacterized protein (TIGR02466 family)